MKSLGIARCNLESILFVSEAIKRGYGINITEDEECPCGEIFAGTEDFIERSDFIISFSIDANESLLLKSGSKAIPPIYSLNFLSHWGDIAGRIGIPVWNDALPSPPFEDGEILSMLVARSRKGEVKHYPPSRMFHLDRYTYMASYKPPRNILWSMWDISSRIAEESGFVGLAAITFVHRNGLHLYSVKFNSLENNEWTIGATPASPFEQVLRAIEPAFLGETDLLIESASMRFRDLNNIPLKSLYRVEGLDLIIHGGEAIVIIRDADRERLTDKVKRAIKIINRGRASPDIRNTITD